MTSKIIIIHDSASNIDISNIFELAPKNNTKIPLIISRCKTNDTTNKIIYKNIKYNLNKKEIINKINKIIENLPNDITFDTINIELTDSIYDNNTYYYLPSFNQNDSVSDYKLISLYESYLNLDNTLIIYIVNDLINNSYFELLNNDNTIILYSNNSENINLDNYKNHFLVNDSSIDNFKDYYNKIINNSSSSNNNDSNDKIDNDKIDNDNDNDKINEILSKLYLDLDNYEPLIKSDYNNFYNNIYISDNYRHYHYYKNIEYKITSKNYDEIKKNYNGELLDHYKKYEELINKLINYFDEEFDFYIKKLEPEILKYFVTMYYNSKIYTAEFELEKDNEFILMLKGLRKMCIVNCKKKLNIL